MYSVRCMNILTVCMMGHCKVPDDGVGQLQTLQAQVVQEAAVTQDALQGRCGDDGVGQIHLLQLQQAAIMTRLLK